MRSLTATYTLGAMVGAAMLAGAMGCGGESTPALPSGPTTHPSTVTVRIQTIPLDGWTIRDAFVLSRQSGGVTDSVPIDVSGRATLRVLSGSTLDLRIDVPAPRLYYASTAVQAVTGDTTLAVVMVPTSWVVQRGRYAGKRREIDLVKAFGSDNDDTHFLNPFAPSRKILVAWPDESLPIAVGFDSTGMTRRWSDADSVWFWTALKDVNDAMGRAVFRPTGNVGVATRNVIGLHVDFDNGGYYGSLGTNPEVCKLPARVCQDLRGAVSLSRGIFFHSVFDEANVRSMQHEMMHALGFGHACYWSSVMMHTGGACLSTVPNDVTVDDVAYVELVSRLASVLVTYPQAWSLDEAFSGTR